MSEHSDNNSEQSGKSYSQPALSPEFQKLAHDEQQRHNKEIEDQFPGIKGYFDLFLRKDAYAHESYDERFGLLEFPIRAALAVYDQDRNQLMPKIYDSNQTNHHWQDRHVGVSTDHAEKRVIEGLQRSNGSKHLPEGSILITTLEPCAMCTSAFLHSINKGHEGTIIFGASQSDIRGKAVEFMDDMWFDEEAEKVNSSKVLKPFRTEPDSYHVEEFVNLRNPQIKVFGNYRSDEVLEFMKVFDLPK